MTKKGWYIVGALALAAVVYFGWMRTPSTEQQADVTTGEAMTNDAATDEETTGEAMMKEDGSRQPEQVELTQDEMNDVLRACTKTATLRGFKGTVAAAAYYTGGIAVGEARAGDLSYAAALGASTNEASKKATAQIDAVGKGILGNNKGFIIVGTSGSTEDELGARFGTECDPESKSERDDGGNMLVKCTNTRPYKITACMT